MAFQGLRRFFQFVLIVAGFFSISAQNTTEEPPDQSKMFTMILVFGILGIIIGLAVLALVIALVCWVCRRGMNNPIDTVGSKPKTHDPEDPPKFTQHQGGVTIRTKPDHGQVPVSTLTDVPQGSRPSYSVFIENMQAAPVISVHMRGNSTLSIYQTIQGACSQFTRSETIKEETIVPIEAITVTEGYTRVKPITSGSVRAGKDRHSIMVPSGDGASATKCFPGMKVSKLITPKGGKIDLEGVQIDIPEGALDKPTEITLGIVWNTSRYPSLSPGKAMISPMVMCEPNGLEFKKPATLKLPHCAVNVKTDWKVEILTSRTAITEPPQWESAAQQGSQALTIGQNHLSVKIEHFSDYMAAGEGASEGLATMAVKMLVYAASVKAGSPFKIHVYCVQDYEKSSDTDVTIAQVEKDIPNEVRMETPKPMLIHENKKNVVVKVKEVSEGWKKHLENLTSKELDFDQIWLGLNPNVSLLLIPDNAESKSIISTIESFQIGWEQKKQEMIIATDVQM